MSENIIVIVKVGCCSPERSCLKVIWGLEFIGEYTVDVTVFRFPDHSEMFSMSNTKFVIICIIYICP